MDAMRQTFEAASQAAFARLRDGELATLWYEDERSRFVRLNGARLRQAGEVRRPVATLRLIRGERQASCAVTLAGRAGPDAQRLQKTVTLLREALEDSEPDPHLLVARGPCRTDSADAAQMPDAFEIAQRIARAARGQDLAGFVAGGPLARGFASATASSREAEHWFEAGSVSVDFSIHRSPAAALKMQLAGKAVDDATLDAALRRARRLSEWLDRPAVPVAPGMHRALLEPAAVGELIEMLQWDGFSARAHRTHVSPLQRLHDGERALDARIGLAEVPAECAAAHFQQDGFVKPERLDLIDAGRPAALLVSPRSAREFGLASNGASQSEAPSALCLSPGALPDEASLRALDTGLWIANLWYLNWSDRMGARLTGMTRFASFWVRDGRVVGPVAPVRFDDSVYRILGDALEAIGATAHFLPDLSTYDGRATGGVRAPALLLRQLRIVS